MGMFDSIRTPCPNCGEELEFQTKGGECILASYPLDEIPTSAAEYAIGDKEQCTNCDVIFEISLAPKQVLTVEMCLTQVEGWDDEESEFTSEEIETMLIK